MSIQKKSLVGSPSAEKKVTAQPVKGSDGIGEAKTLAANALRRKGAGAMFFRAAKKTR